MSQLVFNTLLSTCIYILIAQSFRVIYGIVRFLHILHAITVTLGSYFTYLVVIQLSLPIYAGIPISVLIGIGLISLINRLIYLPLMNKGYENWLLLIASLGGYVVLQNIVSIVWGDSIQSLRTWPVKPGNQFLGAYITDVQIITIVSSILLVSVTWLFIERTRIGKEIKAVSENNDLSRVFGISSSRAITWSFAIGSGLAACAGILIALDTDMTPTMGFNWLLYGVVAMIIGGMGKIHHLLLGCLLLASTQHLAAYYLDSKWMNATAFILLILFLAWRPYGFSRKKLKKAEI